MSTITTFTSTDNGPIWREGLNDNFSSLNTDLVQAEADIDEMNDVLLDASATVKGRTKLSTAPASPTNPISVGTNDTRIPTQDENDAASGTYGTPSSSNKFATSTDPTLVSGNVLTTTDQTIGGIKTFSSIPVLSGTPTNANDMVTKSYVDSLFANF